MQKMTLPKGIRPFTSSTTLAELDESVEGSETQQLVFMAKRYSPMVLLRLEETELAQLFVDKARFVPCSAPCWLLFHACRTWQVYREEQSGTSDDG